MGGSTWGLEVEGKIAIYIRILKRIDERKDLILGLWSETTEK